jgi:rhamnosyltransferase
MGCPADAAARRPRGSGPVSETGLMVSAPGERPLATDGTQQGSRRRLPAAGTVLFNPDTDILRGLISAIAGEVQAIIVIANSPLSASVAVALSRAAGRTELTCEEYPDNIGLAAAYSRIVELAAARGASEVILFDQDSSPAPGTITKLAALMDTLQAAGVRPAVVGPRPIAPSQPGSPHKPPTIHPHRPGTRIGSAQAVWFVISSGGLISLAALAEVGSFEADFFIDAIDVEWCMRAWSRGYSCWLAEDVRMPHRLGAGLTKIAWPPWAFTLQPAWRLTLYARNQASLLGRRYVPLRWKLQWTTYFAAQVVFYAVIDRGRLGRAAALVKGFVAGLRGRLGPPADRPWGG